MRKMANSKLLKICFFVLWVGIAIGCIKMKVEAGLQDNAYVTFSPDGKAFTTNADETDTKWYESGLNDKANVRMMIETTDLDDNQVIGTIMITDFDWKNRVCS